MAGFALNSHSSLAVSKAPQEGALTLSRWNRRKLVVLRCAGASGSVLRDPTLPI